MLKLVKKYDDNWSLTSSTSFTKILQVSWVKPSTEWFTNNKFLRILLFLHYEKFIKVLTILPSKYNKFTHMAKMKKNNLHLPLFNKSA